MDNFSFAPDFDPTEFASLSLLEQGDVDVWVRRRGALLIEKSKETAKDCEAGKLASALTVGAAVVMSSNPLAWLPLTIGAIGYVYTVFQEFQDTGSIRVIPLYRGKLGDILRVMEGGQGEQRHPLEDQIEYLSEAEKDEVLLINYRFGEIAGILNSAPPKVRFDLYRHVCGQFHARRDLLTGEEVAHYVNNAVSEARRTMPPQQEKPTLPKPPSHSAIGQNTRLNAIPTKSEDISDSEASKERSADRTPTHNQQPVTNNSQPTTDIDPTSEKAGLEILDALATTRRSTLLIGDTGAGKSVTQAYLLNKLFECHPNAEVFVLSQKADSFCGLAEKGRVTLFDPTQPEDALCLIHSIWILYDHRRRLPESERPALSPVRLILADWLSINQALEDLKNEECVKASKYLSKLADIIYNGRELNVCLLVDLQSYNLAAVGLKADRNSRKNFNLIGLGNYSIDELGMVNESYGVLTNLIGDCYIVADESERSVLNATFKKLQPISKANQRPIIFSGLSPAQLALLPDLRRFKNSKVPTVLKQPVTVIESTEEAQQQAEAIALNESVSDLKVSDVLAANLGEPLRTIWVFAKQRGDWVTVRDIQRKDFATLKGRGSEQIRQYLGLLADSGYGEIDEEGKSNSSVGFRPY